MFFHSSLSPNFLFIYNDIMKIEDLKKKFKHKTKADLEDLDLALRAVPFLVRKVEALEAELTKRDERIFHLTSQMKKLPPLSGNWSKGDSKWSVLIDEDKNRLHLSFSGAFDYKLMKIASNNITPILSNIQKGCDVINDIGHLDGMDNRVKFHFKKILYTLDVMGVGRIIHILQTGQEPIVTVLQDMSQNAGYQTFTAVSIDEANNILDKSNQFLKV